MARDFDDIDLVASGGWLKPKNYVEVAAMLVAPKAVRVERRLKYKADPSKPKSDPSAWANSPILVADVHVFKSFTSAESGIPDEVLENVNMEGSGLAMSFATLSWQDVPGSTHKEVASAEMKPGAVGAITRPVRLEKNHDFHGRWEFSRLDPAAKGYAQMIAYRDGLPDPTAAPQTSAPTPVSQVDSPWGDTPVAPAQQPVQPAATSPWGDVPVPF